MAQIKAIHAVWAQLEQHAVMTPYQQFSWCRTWYNTVSPHVKEQPFIVAIKTTDGTPLALFPFAIRRSLFATRAYFIGMSHSNYNMGIFAPHAHEILTPDVLGELFRQAGHDNGIDCFLLANQPRSWQEHINPLTVSSEAAHSPSPAFRADLPSDPDVFFNNHYNARNKRKRFRYKERQLAMMGDYTFSKATTFLEKKEILDAFLQHKKNWFFDHGINNPFSPAWIKEFFVTLTAYEDSPLEFYALRSPTHIASIFCVSVQGKRMSALFTSIDPGETARVSPGELLLIYLIQSCCFRGITSFDLGIGEARYKESFCPIEDMLLDYALPVTLKGQFLSFGWKTWQRTKGWIKRHPLVFKTTKRLVRSASNALEKLSPEKKSKN